ncbi:hypothetical protein N0B31_04300 [Salinirubellus salinus]|uniref:DUF7979 domain-containing protein n=1 Tax=Salinirubellus salinus TaxID=1364945 RepID=A0A9E7R5C8_9EURY|nr:hypothetical protein [Salinirubellus salinus]UWM55509.1 hypothetical protein N0B31_04300 [Salinirubellus salinus]
MPSPDARRLRIAGLVVAVVLLGLAAYPGTLASPYETTRGDPSYDHAIVTESSATYDEYAADPDIEIYRYEELSPAAQDLFDRALAEPDGVFEPTVCRGFVLVCDGYAQSDLPPEFEYGTRLRPDEALQFVEKGGERYLFRTGTINHATLFGFSNLLFLAWPTVIPLGILVARAAYAAESDRYVAGVTAFGAVVAALSLVAPYLEMYRVVGAFWVGVAVLAATWLAIVAAGTHRVYRWVVARRGTEPTGGV